MSKDVFVDGNDGLTEDLHASVTAFDERLSIIEDLFKNLSQVPLSEIQAQMSSFDKAKLDVLGAYAVNSLFWMYLRVNGEDPTEHGIKKEIEIVQSYMSRVEEVDKKLKAAPGPKLNIAAATRFLRNALWDKAHKSTPGSKRNVTDDDSGPSNADANTLSSKIPRLEH